MYELLYKKAAPAIWLQTLKFYIAYSYTYLAQQSMYKTLKNEQTKNLQLHKQSLPNLYISISRLSDTIASHWSHVYRLANRFRVNLFDCNSWRGPITWLAPVMWEESTGSSVPLRSVC